MDSGSDQAIHCSFWHRTLLFGIEICITSKLNDCKTLEIFRVLEPKLLNGNNKAPSLANNGSDNLMGIQIQSKHNNNTHSDTQQNEDKLLDSENCPRL
jgi:hypothetical protein